MAFNTFTKHQIFPFIENSQKAKKNIYHKMNKKGYFSEGKFLIILLHYKFDKYRHEAERRD